MLVIRAEQMQVFQDRKIDDFVERLSRHLARAYFDDYAELGEEEMRRLIHTAVDLGERHGVTGAGSVARLAELMIEFGREFELSPDQDAALRILSHPQLPGEVKVEAISEQLRERTEGRRIVAVSYDESGA